MSLKPVELVEVPAETVRVARAVFPQGNALMRIRDEFGTVFADELFADLFPAKGQPAHSPGQLALVLVLQFWEGLTDRQAADAVRSRIDWKYALGLELTDPGFDHSVLSEFRSRLVAGHASLRLLDRLLILFQDRGLLKARGQQRTDSTHVLAAVRTLNRLELVGETLRQALNTVAQCEPAWLLAVAPEAWAARYARRFDEMHLPKSQTQRDQLAEQIGHDGQQLLRLLSMNQAPPRLRELDCVKHLEAIWPQQFRLENRGNLGVLRWRPNKQVPPASDLILSPFDPEARYCTRNGRQWRGYRVHFTETCDDAAQLQVITQVETAPAPEQDETALPRIQASLAQRGFLPQAHLMDAGYVSADLLVNAARDYGVEIVGPFTRDVSWQAREQTGYDLSHFRIDWKNHQAICPQGQRSQRWTVSKDPRGLEVLMMVFRRAVCSVCPALVRCTRSRSQRRYVWIRPQPQFEAIQRARRTQTTAVFYRRYVRRLGIEGTFSQAVRAFGVRRSRYVGLAKTHVQMVATAAAINLERFADFLGGLRPVAVRSTAWAALTVA